MAISNIPKMRIESVKGQAREVKKLIREPVSPIESADRIIRQFREENRREIRAVRRV